MTVKKTVTFQVEPTTTSVETRAEEIYQRERFNQFRGLNLPSWESINKNKDPYSVALKAVAIAKAEISIKEEETIKDKTLRLCNMFQDFANRFPDGAISDDKFQLKQSIFEEIRQLRMKLLK